MNTTEIKTSPLRKRMIDDMVMRKFKPDTQREYIRAVKKLADFLNKSPANTTQEDLRLFQLHLVKTGTSGTTINATLCGLRFFFQVTLDRSDIVQKISNVPVPRKLPVILSIEEVTRLIEVATPKYQAAFSVAYGAGLRKRF